MARTKKKKITSVIQLPNVFDAEEEKIKSQLKKYFNNKNSSTLEIGCGHGDYTIELASIYPDRNFIGIDMKGARVYTAAERALALNLTNAAFIWGRAEKLNDIFEKDSVDEIFIPFPDPHIKRRSIPRRLIAKDFLKIYKSILTEEGIIHLKTDNEDYYHFALKVLNEKNCKIYYSSANIYEESEINEYSSIKTRYEEYYLKEGRTIKYICFGF